MILDDQVVIPRTADVYVTKGSLMVVCKDEATVIWLVGRLPSIGSKFSIGNKFRA